MKSRAEDKLRLKVIKTADERQLFRGVKKLLLGLSGGVDSTVLYDVLLSLRERYGFELCAAHVNHMIRGAESDRDEEFVRKLCEANGTPLFCARLDVPAAAKEHGLSLEEEARNMRYAFFAATAREISADAVATAHNADDNAETVLFNLARGASLNGLCGVPYKRDIYVRPLLDVSREEIDAYAERHSLSFVYDSTNSETEYSRNKIRHNVIPVLKELNPSFTSTVCEETKQLEEIRDYIRREARKLSGDVSGNDKVLLSEYVVSLSPVTTDAETVSRIVAALRSKQRRTFSLKDGIFAICGDGCLSFGSADEAITAEKPPEITDTTLREGENILAGGACALYFFVKNKNFYAINNFTTTTTMYSANISGGITVRKRLSGDTLRIGGMTKSLKKEFINKKIPARVRDTVPVICDAESGEIICVPFVGTADKYKGKELVYVFGINY